MEKDSLKTATPNREKAEKMMMMLKAALREKCFGLKTRLLNMEDLKLKNGIC